MNDLTDYIKKAFEYKNNGEYKEAIDFFYKALALDNESAEIMSELADLYAKLCQYDRAFSFYEQVVIKNPTNYHVKFLYALLLKRLKDYEKAQNILEEIYQTTYESEKVAEELFSICVLKDDYSKIISYFNHHSNNLSSSINLYYVGLAYSKTGREDIAKEYFDKSFSIDKNNIDAGIKVAELFFAGGQTKEAEQIVSNLLKVSEDDRLLYLMAEISYAVSQYDNALKYYSYAIKSNPQNALYYFKIAIIFSVKGFFKEAEEAYCKATSIDQNNVMYNYALAYLYYINGKYLLAEKVVDFILSISENHAQAVALKIILLVEKGEVAQAGKLVDKIYENADSDDFSYYAKAYYYSKLNSWEKALVSIIKAVELNPNSLEYKYQMAKLYYNISEFEKAENIANKILKINPKYIQAYILLADINLKNRKLDLATQNIDLALKLDKNSFEAYFILADICFAKSNLEKAIENYKIALSINPKKVELYSKIAACYFCMKKYSDAYSYYKEASSIEISEPEYRYYMAKCCEFLDDKENAIS